MVHLPDLISDLGFILITAALVTLLCKRLNQPVVLGYLIAGFLVGPHIPIIPTVKDTESVKVWAEIGVIILLFGLGLEFSFKKLFRVGVQATGTGLVEVIGMIFVGFFTGQLMGWSYIDSVFLGGVLSVSSTTIIVKAFDEAGLKGRKFVSLVFGVLIVEDIAAILLLVLLSTVAISQAFSGTELVMSGGRLLFFLSLWFVLGIYLLPSFLARIKPWLNDETRLVIALGLCLLMVMIATSVGFSPALGAFVMGSLLAETREGVRIDKLIHPVRDLFAAVFFVSVGMLIDPAILMQYYQEIIIITLVTLAGKLVTTTVGAVVSGSSFRHSVQAGMSLAQIGEFSFIIATLGVTLKVTSEFLYPIVVSVSAITTFTTPYMIRYTDQIYAGIEKYVPKGLLAGLKKYELAVQSEGSRTGITKLLWNALGWRVIVNSIMAIAVFGLASQLLLPFLEGIEMFSLWSHIITGLAATLFAMPFIWAVAFRVSNAKFSEEEKQRLERLRFGVKIVRVVFAGILSGVLVNHILPLETRSGFLVYLILLATVILGGFSARAYKMLEGRFLSNFDSNEPTEAEAKNQAPALAPWDAALTDFTLHPDSSLVGKSLLQSKLKEVFGITIALIERGSKKIMAPDRDFVLMPFDRLYLIGSDEQLQSVRPLVETQLELLDTETSSAFESFGLKSVRLDQKSPFTGKVLRESGLREAISGLVVGIERSGERILSPDSSLVLQNDDLLWVVGDLERIKKIMQSDQDSHQNI